MQIPDTKEIVIPGKNGTLMPRIDDRLRPNPNPSPASDQKPAGKPNPVPQDRSNHPNKGRIINIYV